ncbi:hypothetical protein PtB15_4B33 [Puccinia triticina]|nr:hypothetical protein PtB15_4B33 [Puccinia triticina]
MPSSSNRGNRRVSRTIIYFNDRRIVPESALPEMYQEINPEGMDTDARLRSLTNKVNQIIQVCNAEARQFHNDIEAVEERIDGLLRIIEGRGMVGVPKARVADTVEEEDVTSPGAAEREDTMDVDHSVDPHQTNERAGPEPNVPDGETIPDNIEALHGLVAAMKKSISRAVLSTMFNSELFGRITEEEKARLLSAAGIPPVHGVAQVGAIVDQAFVGRVLDGLNRAAWEDEAEFRARFWSLLGTEQKATAEFDKHLWQKVAEYRTALMIERQPAEEVVFVDQDEDDGRVELAVVDPGEDEGRVEPAVVERGEDEGRVEPAVVDRGEDDGDWVEPTFTDRARERDARRNEIRSEMRAMEGTIRRARRTIARAELRIASATQLLEESDAELLRTFYDEEEDAQAEHRRIQDQWYAKREVRMRWEGADFEEDWADVADDGEGYEDYMRRITGLLQLRDMAEEAAQQDNQAFQVQPPLRVESPAPEASPAPESLERSEAGASPTADLVRMSPADDAEEDWVDAAEDQRGLNVATGNESKRNIVDSEPVAGPSSKRARYN